MKNIVDFIQESLVSEATVADVAELFGTLQQSSIETWRNHLKADKHDVHVILDDFYTEIVEMVDDLIEHYMGRHGKVDHYKNILDFDEDPISYLTKLREIVDNGKNLLDTDELKSDADDILGLIDSTLYKLKEL